MTRRSAAIKHSQNKFDIRQNYWREPDWTRYLDLSSCDFVRLDTVHGYYGFYHLSSTIGRNRPDSFLISLVAGPAGYRLLLAVRVMQRAYFSRYVCGKLGQLAATCRAAANCFRCDLAVRLRDFLGRRLPLHRIIHLSKIPRSMLMAYGRGELAKLPDHTLCNMMRE